MRIIKEVSSLVEDKIKLEKRIFDKWVVKMADNKPVQATDESVILLKELIKFLIWNL
jgi:hypothetical protein